MQKFASFGRRLSYGLTRRLWFVFCLSTVAFVSTILLLNVEMQFRLMEQRTDLRAHHLSELIAAVTLPKLERGDTRDLEVFLRQLYEYDDVHSILIVDQNARSVLSGDGSDLFSGIQTNPLIDEVLRTGTAIQTLVGHLIYRVSPMYMDGQLYGAVVLKLDPNSMLEEVRAVWEANVWAGLLFIIVGCLLSSLLAGRLTGSLRNLTAATERVTQGDFDQEISIKSNDELEVLASRFNAMLGTIQASMSETHRIAYEDKLTNIPNRGWLNMHLEKLSNQDAQTAFAVMFLDLDQFKQVNDTHGHHVGDLLLREFASRLHTCMIDLGMQPRVVGLNDGRHIALDEDEAVLARLGGDEFTLLVPADRAEELAKRIMAALDTPIILDGRRLTTSTSIGIALFPDHAQNREDLLKAADIAMYQAKSAGRRTYAYYDHSNFTELQATIGLEEDLNRAIHEDEFQLYLQPQFELATDRVIGAEALIRWQHPTRGLISPGEFLPVATSAGLLPIIGQIMLRKTIQATARINKDRLEPVTLAVNISIEELDQEGFADAVARMLNFYGASATTLEIEITEGTAMEENARIVQQVAMLQALGVKLAIDDFGMGYSNLSRLKELAFETLKIDRSLVEGVGQDGASETLFLTILELAEAIDARVVAEGVETEAQRTFLRNSNCHCYQGFIGGRPVPADRFEEWIADLDMVDEVAGAEAEANAA